MGLDKDPPFEALAFRSERPIILIDPYEMLAPLTGGSETCLPQLPENVLLVLAGRDPPTAD